MVEGVRVERLDILTRVYGTPVMPALLAKLATEPADILHANFPSPYIACLTAVASKLKTTQSVLTWHNDLPQVTRAAGIIVEVHDRIALPIYLPSFSRVITTSKHYASTSRNLRRFPERVVVIPNGVDTTRFNPKVNGEEIRQRLGLADHRVLLFVGALTQWHRYKGLDVLLSAMSRLKKLGQDVRLIVVGDGSLAPEYRSLANSLRMSEDVVFAGNVSDDDLPGYYACADILILPSKDRSEGFGLTILEANATGKPAIGSNVGGIPSVIEDGKNGKLVPPNDPAALSETIRELFTSDALLDRLGRNARSIAEKHDWSIVAEQTERVYESARLANESVRPS
jgi:glycosyltransferase involved in cell wall biosynthesis